MDRLTPAEIAGGAVGLVVGLLIAFLIKGIVFRADLGRRTEPEPISRSVLYLIVAIFAAYLGARIGAKDPNRPGSARSGAATRRPSPPSWWTPSAIVDGRIVDILREAAFLDGALNRSAIRFTRAASRSPRFRRSPQTNPG